MVDQLDLSREVPKWSGTLTKFFNFFYFIRVRVGDDNNIVWSHLTKDKFSVSLLYKCLTTHNITLCQGRVY